MKISEMQKMISGRQKDLNPTISHTEMVESAERSILEAKEAMKTELSLMPEFPTTKKGGSE